jgi:exodeoxyribonuclease VII large subunit
MKRPPFDPSRARGDSFDAGLFDPEPARAAAFVRNSPVQPMSEAQPTAPAQPGPQREFSVSAMNDLIARTLEDGMRGVFRVHGEIANLSKQKHWYFSIKDAKSLIRCVMWQSDAQRVGFVPREGDAIVVTGKIGHYAPQGATQLQVSKIEPQGVGALELRFQALVAELRALGYFEDARKRPLPAHPRRVAVITSASGAAVQDVIKTAREMRAAVEFLVIDVRVQGDGAAPEVTRALRAVARTHESLGIDAVIVTRGGGSREDLWAFNERSVADAAFALPTPLVAAIGHEVDTSVIELVADRRASTPTQAVMLLLPDNAALAERCDRLARDLRNSMRWSIQARREQVGVLERSPALASPALRIADARRSVDRSAQRLRMALAADIAHARRGLEHVAARLARNSPAARVAAASANLAALRPRLARAITQQLASARTTVAHLDRRLRSAGPAETLARGYAIVTDERGGLVRSVGAEAAGIGRRLAVQVADGTIGVRVEEKSQIEATTQFDATAPEADVHVDKGGTQQ